MQSAGIYFFRPPYEELTPVTPESTPRGIVPGAAVVWAMSADSLPTQRACIAQRPRGTALVIVLPPPAEIPAIAHDLPRLAALLPHAVLDRKSTRLNSSHLVTSYAVVCLKKKHDRESSGRD